MAVKYDSLSIPNFPALAYNISTSLLLGHTNKYPDEGNSNVVIPIRLKSYQTPGGKYGVEPVGSAPLLRDGSSSIGVKVAAAGVIELTKVTLEGEIDTPCTLSGTYNVPTLTFEAEDIIRFTYGELIQAATDGSLQTGDTYTPIGNWKRRDPLWFRDPFGRVYNSPRVLSFEASLVEQVPGRNTFSMTMKV